MDRNDEKPDPYTPEVISRLTQGWFSRDHSGLVLITNDPRAVSEDAPYTGIQFGLANFMAMLSEFDRLRTSLAIRDKALGWQTIDSAPRDGSSFLACIKHGDRWHIVIAGFAKNGILFDTNGDSCVGWDPCGKFGREEANRPKWQPLPELPAQALSPNTTDAK